jgi:hypothetical protein
LRIYDTLFTPEEAARLAEFAAKPPKPKYRITKTFDEEPSVVASGIERSLLSHFPATEWEIRARSALALAPSDIEEVWE